MRLPSLPRGALGPILLLSMLLIMFISRQPASPGIPPPWAISSGPAVSMPDMTDLPDFPALSSAGSTSFVPGQPLQRENLTLHVPSDLYTSGVQVRLALELEAALRYTSERFGSPPASPLQIVMASETPCMLHGAAFTNERRLLLASCPTTPTARVVSIAAHEFVHQLAHDYYGPVHQTTDVIVLEGLATWGAGSYWLGNQPSFRAFVQQHYASSLLPLATPYQGRPVADMNQLYYQWASFIEYLLETYGRERLDAVAITGHYAPGSADYAGIYGTGLDALEQDWRAWLSR